MKLETFVDRDALATTGACRLGTVIAEAIAERGKAVLALTGGGAGTAVLAALTGRSIDWSLVHVTWSDERFVSADSPDRNAVQAYEALLSKVNIPSDNVYELPAAGTSTLDAAAEVATATLAALGPADVTLLGVGPDAHIASLFPGLPAVSEVGARVVAVTGSPKPPPERLSFTFDAIAASKRTWLVVTGADKADAVSLALSDAAPEVAPAAHARGAEETILFADSAAAALALA